MGLFGGIKKAAGGALKIVTAPAATVAKVAGTGLETTGKVLGELATGDVKGAAGAAADGVKKQAGNVGGYFTQQFNGVKDVAGGTAEFVGGGFKLIGEPVKGAARIASAPLRSGAQMVGTGLETSGKVLGELAEGDLSGAGGAVVDGWKKQGDHTVGYFKEYGKGAKEIFGGPAGVVAAGATALGGAAVSLGKDAYGGVKDYASDQVDGLRQGAELAGKGAGVLWNGAQDYAEYQVDSYRQGAETLGRGLQTGLQVTGSGLETAGVKLQEAAG